MAPLRTALIGLSASAKTSWASGAHLPGLLTSTGRSKLPIVALLNSSVSAAQAAIKEYKLEGDVKAYGTPEDLANDPDVDLVICNTRVDVHYDTILPSIKKGKDVYVEWPIAHNLEKIEELVEEAKKSGSRVAVGLQRRWVPSVVKLRSLLQEGKLGKVLSSEVRAYGGTNDREIVPTTLKYFTQREIGGNPIVIGFGHCFDTVLSVLGDLDEQSVSSRMQLQRPSVRVRDPATTDTIVETITSNVPDLLTFHGTVVPSQATLSFFYRRGQPFPGAPALNWTINCEKGEIRFLSPTGLNLEVPEELITIQVHWYEDDRVEEIPWSWSAEQAELRPMARSVSSSLFAFADGKAEGDGWVSIDDAAKRARIIDGFFKTWDKSGSK